MRLFQNKRSMGTWVSAVVKFCSVAADGQSRKVPAKISGGGFRAVENIQNIGKTTSRQAATSSTCTPRALAPIVDPALSEVELQRGEHEEHEEDQRGGGGGVADAEVLETQLVDEVAHVVAGLVGPALREDRKSTRLNSSHQIISYAVFCLKKKKKKVHMLY